MDDKKFKALPHPVGNNRIASRGEAVSSGYHPDITVRNTENRLIFIIECEQKTDRKAFLGALIKAELYSEQECVNPILVIVMQPKPNTTTLQIANHLRPYISWLAAKQGGKMNLELIHILSDIEYEIAIMEGEQISSVAFRRRGHVLQTSNQSDICKTN